MFSSLVNVLMVPAAAVIGLLCLLVCGGLLIFRRGALSKPVKAVLAVVLVVSIAYLLFLLWLIIGFGRNSGPEAAPIPR